MVAPPMSAPDPFARLADEERELLQPAPLPDRVEAMKALLTDERFSDPDWIYERKLDGIRCIAIKGERNVRLLSRNDLSLNGRFPEVVEALEADDAERIVLDGEVVAFDGAQTSFARLQQRHERPVAVFYYVFDLLQLAGQDVTALPLRARKALLRRALGFHGPVRLTPHRNRDGEAALPRGLPQGLGGPDRQARRLALRARALARLAEVQVLGRAGARDRRLHRSARQPHGPRRAPARALRGRAPALRRQGGHRLHAGRRCTTWPSDCEPLRRDDSPFADEIRERDVTWVKPELVAQIGFSEWTRDGRLRHPRFLGLRDDKPAREVVRERP